MKINLYEKSYQKCVLKQVSEELKLNTNIIQKDILKLEILKPEQ